MKELICLQGTLGFDGQTYHKGDHFEAHDEMADHLLKHRLARVMIPKPAPIPDPEPEPDQEPEIAPSTAPMIDLEELNIQEVKKIIDETDDREDLVALHEQEEAGKNRKTVTDAIVTKINSL